MATIGSNPAAGGEDEKAALSLSTMYKWRRRRRRCRRRGPSAAGPFALNCQNLSLGGVQALGLFLLVFGTGSSLGVLAVGAADDVDDDDGGRGSDVVAARVLV